MQSSCVSSGNEMFHLLKAFRSRGRTGGDPRVSVSTIKISQVSRKDPECCKLFTFLYRRFVAVVPRRIVDKR